MPATLSFALARSRYRVGQVIRGLRTTLNPEETRLITSLLEPPELRLFVAMHPRDRRHSFDVLRALEAGDPPPSLELRQAALLHDVGKGDLALWHRVAFVLLEAGAPTLLERLAVPEGWDWRRALWRLRHHAALGAESLAAVGAHPRVVAMVGGHSADPGDDAELVRLVEADRAS
jgi:hypothetical protein